MLFFFLKGIAAGFSIAAPVGPIGFLCVQRTLAHGMRGGLAVGLGAACADAVYGLVSAFGLTMVTDFMAGNQDVFKLVGGLFLLWLGVSMFRTTPPDVSENRPVEGLIKGIAGSFLSTFFLTLTNPMTILFFFGIFAGLGLGQTDGSYGSATVLVAGVFTGSALWWVLLSYLSSKLRERVAGMRRTISRVAGTVVGAFGIAALLSLL